jgi:hypothetical protein
METTHSFIIDCESIVFIKKILQNNHEIIDKENIDCHHI